MKASISASSASAEPPAERSNSRSKSKDTEKGKGKEQKPTDRSRSKSRDKSQQREGPHQNQPLRDLLSSEPKDAAGSSLGKRESLRNSARSGLLNRLHSGRISSEDRGPLNVAALVSKFANKAAEAEAEAKEQAETMDRRNSSKKRREREAAAAATALSASGDPSIGTSKITVQGTAAPTGKSVPIANHMQPDMVDLVEEEIEVADVEVVEGVTQHDQNDEADADTMKKRQSRDISHVKQLAQGPHPETLENHVAGMNDARTQNPAKAFDETVAGIDAPIPVSEPKPTEEEGLEYEEVEAFELYSAVPAAAWNPEVVSRLFLQNFDPSALTQADLERAVLEQSHINMMASKKNGGPRPKSTSAEESNPFAVQTGKPPPFRDSSSLLVAQKSLESKGSSGKDGIVSGLENPSDCSLPSPRFDDVRVDRVREPAPNPFALSKSQQQMVDIEQAEKDRPAMRDSYLRFQLESSKTKGSTKAPVLFAVISEKDKVEKAKQEKGTKSVAIANPTPEETGSKQELVAGAKSTETETEDNGVKKQRTMSKIIASALPGKIETISRERTLSKGGAKNRERSYSRKALEESEPKSVGKLRALSKRFSKKGSQNNDMDRPQAAKSQSVTSWKDAVAFGHHKTLNTVQRYSPVPSPDDIEFCPVGLRTAVDIVAFLDNGIRRDILDLYVLLNTLGNRLADLTLREVAVLFEWWGGTRTCILEVIDMRETMMYQRLESRGANLEFELSAAKRGARRDGLYRALAAIDALELKFVHQETDNLFVELVQNCEQLRKLLVQDMKIAETEGAAELERYLDGTALAKLEAEIYKYMYKHSSSELLLPTCVSWVTDEQLFMSWENKHLHGLQRIRFKHMYRKYQAKHLALGTVLVEESSGAASSAWFKP